MTKYFLSILLYLIFSSVKSQHKVIDAKTKAPISYAHIKLKDKSKGTIADFNGDFGLDSSYCKNDTLIISCIGYQPKSFLVRNVQNMQYLELKPNLQMLSEVVVNAKKTKFRSQRLGITKRPRKSDFITSGTANNGEEKAVWIPNEYAIKGKLNTINVFVTDLGYPNAHFRIHVYDCNPLETKPGKELTKSNIIASATKGNEWVSVDMSSEHIQFGENGCFIGIEWFDAPESKFYKDTVYVERHTWRNNKLKDTTYSIIRSGNGASIGSVPQKYRHFRNKLWEKKGDEWINYGKYVEPKFYTTDTMPDGTLFFNTPDNHFFRALCINVDVSFPKNRNDLIYEAPRKRKLNKLERVKKDSYKYPQNSIYELLSSLIKAFENDDVIYVLKYLCVYKDGGLDELLADFSEDGAEGYISNKEKKEIIKHLNEVKPSNILMRLNKE